ncbi:haloacid dehalogenase-like hydrolase [Nocardia aurea]|uniref:Haloacid dehalogenase-like hydrolase n=1 Tax=Nocardia aurea TaxID=2144174 RepID=A0ABV3G1L0_9NOCA
MLWDIDHTLIETRGVGRAAFADAFEHTTGHPLQRMPHITGRNEPDLYYATATLQNLPDPPPFPEFADALASAYENRREQLRRRGRVLPGARATLTHLAEQPDITQSVLTGNTRTVARIKLETFDLHTHLNLVNGAYGDDDQHRPTLVSIAQQRATTPDTGPRFDRHTTVLTGDSPADITTARDGGALVIAVAGSGTPSQNWKQPTPPSPTSPTPKQSAENSAPSLALESGMQKTGPGGSGQWLRIPALACLSLTQISGPRRSRRGRLFVSRVSSRWGCCSPAVPGRR